MPSGFISRHFPNHRAPGTGRRLPALRSLPQQRVRAEVADLPEFTELGTDGPLQIKTSTINPKKG
jgi:hypothetical protein